MFVEPRCSISDISEFIENRKIYTICHPLMQFSTNHKKNPTFFAFIRLLGDLGENIKGIRRRLIIIIIINLKFY